ncbi:MAG: FAD-dependent oxidoreductase [Candidatus Thermoplasmatota archaeon]
MKVAVLGGGALGSSAALALAGRNHEVTLLERATLGSGSTAKAAGILSSFAWNDADYKLIAATRGAIGETIALALAAGERAARGAWRSAPSLVVGSGANIRKLDQLQDRVERHTEECERLGHREAQRAFPGLRFNPGDEAIVAQEDGVIEAGDFLAALRARLDQESVTVQEQSAARLTELRSRFDAVVVAGGAWTKGILNEVGAALPIQAYRTQLASLAIQDGGSLPIVHDLDHHFYTRPESEGSMLAGNGTQLRPFEPDHYNEVGDPEFVHSIAERVVARFADGEGATVRSSWAGLCVATPDRRPLCGAVPGQEGLFVLTGDNGFGLMRSLALGEALADAVAGRPDASLAPGRFGREVSDSFEMREGYGG